MNRGEIWLVSLDPTAGSEITKSRPCVIVSPRNGFTAPFRVPVTYAAKKGLIVLDQIRTVDKIRLVKLVGTINPRAFRTF